MYCREAIIRVLAKTVRLRIPKIANQAEAREYIPHLIGLWAAGISFQSGRVPCLRHAPELLQRNKWSQWNTPRVAPPTG
jgi:hypothetical protein